MIISNFKGMSTIYALKTTKKYKIWRLLLNKAVNEALTFEADFSSVSLDNKEKYVTFDWQ